MPEKPLVAYTGDYHNLYCYQKAELIYDITYRFANTVFQRGDRTIDQMVQAARSGKQNIAEGNAIRATSEEMCLKLLNVARGSLTELLADYEDFLRVNGYKQWGKTSKEVMAMRRLSATNDHERIATIAQQRPADVVANMAIVLLYQTDMLLKKFIKSCSEHFLAEGGFREKMTRERINNRNKRP